jgi:hypothetical protein
MSKNGKATSWVAAAAVLVSGLSLVGDATTDARAESAYPNVGDLPSKRDKPAITVDEQSKLKKELKDAYDRQNSQAKARDGAAQQKSKKP